MAAIQKTILYIKFSIKTFFRHPGINTLLSPFRYFSAWLSSMNPGRNSVADKMPWITYPSIKFLNGILRPHMTLFEYGSGGSTLFWLTKVKKVISVEHDRDWYIILNSEFKKQGINGVDYRLAEAETDENFDKKNFDVPADYISSDQAFTGKNFEKYVKQIDQFPDSFFDIIVVDGRARPSCIAHAINKVKPGGFIIVDNSDREYYFNNIKFDDESWKRKDFPGPIPYTYNFSQTSLFQKIK